MSGCVGKSERQRGDIYNDAISSGLSARVESPSEIGAKQG